MKSVEQLKKKISKFGIDPNELGIFTKAEYKLANDKNMTDNQHFRKR